MCCPISCVSFKFISYLMVTPPAAVGRLHPELESRRTAHFGLGEVWRALEPSFLLLPTGLFFKTWVIIKLCIEVVAMHCVMAFWSTLNGIIPWCTLGPSHWW